MWTASPITLTNEDRAELTKRTTAHTKTVRSARRARIILLAADAVASRQISGIVGMHESNVDKWRSRFRDKDLAGLEDAPRPVVHDASATTNAWPWRRPPQSVMPMIPSPLGTTSIWPATSVAHPHGHMDIRLDQVRGRRNRRDDPEFWSRVRDARGLYLKAPERAWCCRLTRRRPSRPENAVIQTARSVPVGLARRELEYRRHGTASLVAAMDVDSGKVLAQPIERNKSATFCSSPQSIDDTVDKDLAIHVILDNGSSHCSKETKT